MSKVDNLSFKKLIFLQAHHCGPRIGFYVLQENGDILFESDISL